MLFKGCFHKGAERDKCEHAWWVRVRCAGRDIRESLESYFPNEVVHGRGSKSKAKDLERTFIADVKSGKFDLWKQGQVSSPCKDETWASFCDFYVENHILANRLRYDATYRYRMKNIRSRWARRKLKDIKHADVVMFVNEMKKNGWSGNTQRRLFAIVNHMMSFAEEMELIERNPIRRKSIKLDVPNRRGRRLLPHEEDRLIEVLTELEQNPDSPRWKAVAKTACPSSPNARRLLRRVVITALDTGLRKGTIRQLQFKMLSVNEGKNGVLEIPASIMKGRRASKKGLTQRVRTIIDERKEQLFAAGKFSAEAFIFGLPDGTGYETGGMFDAGWAEARKMAGIPVGKGEDALHMHDLRGEFASRLLEAGKDLAFVSRQVDHTNIATTSTYLRARVGEVEEVADVLEKHTAMRAGRAPSLAVEGTNKGTVLPFTNEKADNAV